MMNAVNATLPADAPRRFFKFAEDLPTWEFDEPVWLWLTQGQREQLLALGIVTPLA
jgi:hypothetical protein